MVARVFGLCVVVVVVGAASCSFASLIGGEIPCDHDVSCPPAQICVDGFCERVVVIVGGEGEGEGDASEGEGDVGGEGEGDVVGEGEGEVAFGVYDVWGNVEPNGGRGENCLTVIVGGDEAGALVDVPCEDSFVDVVACDDGSFCFGLPSVCTCDRLILGSRADAFNVVADLADTGAELAYVDGSDVDDEGVWRRRDGQVIPLPVVGAFREGTDPGNVVDGCLALTHRGLVVDDCSTLRPSLRLAAGSDTIAVDPNVAGSGPGLVELANVTGFNRATASVDAAACGETGAWVGGRVIGGDARWDSGAVVTAVVVPTPYANWGNLEPQGGRGENLLGVFVGNDSHVLIDAHDGFTTAACRFDGIPVGNTCTPTAVDGLLVCVVDGNAAPDVGCGANGGSLAVVASEDEAIAIAAVAPADEFVVYVAGSDDAEEGVWRVGDSVLPMVPAGHFAPGESAFVDAARCLLATADGFVARPCSEQHLVLCAVPTPTPPACTATFALNPRVAVCGSATAFNLDTACADAGAFGPPDLTAVEQADGALEAGGADGVWTTARNGIGGGEFHWRSDAPVTATLR